jgi:hypothetical protein
MTQLVAAFVAKGALSRSSQYVVHIGIRFSPAPFDVLNVDLLHALAGRIDERRGFFIE